MAKVEKIRPYVISTRYDAKVKVAFAKIHTPFHAKSD